MEPRRKLESRKHLDVRAEQVHVTNLLFHLSTVLEIVDSLAQKAANYNKIVLSRHVARFEGGCKAIWKSAVVKVLARNLKLVHVGVNIAATRG